MEEAKIQRLVQAAICSPSPGNCQPWSFEWDGRALHVFHRASHARLASDHLSIMSLIGLGMVVEVIEIAASCEQLEASTTVLVPDRHGAVAVVDREEWAVVSLPEGSRQPDPMAPEIPRRCSDRRPCKGGTLQDPVFDELRAMSRRYPGSALHFQDRYPDELLTWLATSLRMYNWFKAFWRDYGAWLRLTERSVQRTRSGIGMRATGTPLSTALLEWAQYHFWPLNLLLRKPAPLSEVTDMLSGRAGMGCISIDPHSPSRVIEAGRLAFRIWLRLGMEGYAVWPLGYYTTHSSVVALGGPPAGMPPDVESEFRRGPDVLRRAFGIDATRLPIWLFSAGIAPGRMPDSHRTLRRPLEQCYRSTAGSHPA